MRVEVELTNGKKVWVGGRPLMSDQELHRHFPELGKAIEVHDAIVAEVRGIGTDDLEAVQRMYPRFEAAQFDLCVEVIALFNEGIERKDCLIDRDTYETIFEVWGGSYQKKT